MEMESGTMPDRAWQLLRTGVALKNHRSRLLALGLLLLMSGCGGGGGGGGTCTPAPAISSSPPTTAEVGRQYQYVVAATHLCGDLLPFVCGNVDAIRLPSGAILNNPPPYVT